jgi:hypothetical protein
MRLEPSREVFWILLLDRQLGVALDDVLPIDGDRRAKPLSSVNGGSRDQPSARSARRWGKGLEQRFFERLAWPVT